MMDRSAGLEIGKGYFILVHDVAATLYGKK